MYIFLLALILGGCGTTTTVKPVYEIKEILCPIEEPQVSCPELPIKPKALRAFYMVWEEAIEINAQCRDGLDTWRDEYRACKNN